MTFAYLDHAATTPMRPAAVEAMLPFLTDRFANPSGAHAAARDARKAVEEARDTVAEALGCAPGELVFTSGGTEADNTAIGAASGRPLVVTAIEHHAVLEPASASGARLVAVDGRGVIDIDALAAALDPSVALVSVMLVNNEVGAIQPLAAVADVVRYRAPGALLHTDAVQALPWLDLGVAAAAADLISVSAHKVGGPKGVGALVVRGGATVPPLLRGGGQERERRAGTQPVGLIAAFAAAVRELVADRDLVNHRVAALRDRLVDGVLAAVPDCKETGERAGKVPGNAHLTFAGVDAEALLVLLERDGVLASAGASCASGALEVSHVLRAMGVPADRARGSVRFSLGAPSTGADVDRALDAIPRAVAHLRAHGGG